MTALQRAMNKSGPLRAAMESIDFQKSHAFFDELTMAISHLREISPNVKNAVEVVGIPKVIFQHTGIHVNGVFLQGFPGAAIFLPLIDGRSPLIIELEEGLQITNDARPGIDHYVAFDYGTVDLTAGKVTGVFSKAIGSLVLGAESFEYLTDREIAAMILHEIGHQFTYFEYMTHTAALAVSLNYCSVQLAETTNKTERVKIIINAATSLGIAVETPEVLADSTDPKIPLTILMETYTRRIRSGTGSDFYDLRSSEALADQYCVRNGAGRDIAVCLDKLSRRFGEYRTKSSILTGYVYFVRTAALLLTTAMGIAVPWVGAVLLSLVGLYMATSFPPEGIYDNPKERMTRIKNELVGFLKDQAIDLQMRETIHADILAVDNIIERMGEFDSFLSIIWRSLTSYRRENYRQIKFQQDLETLAHNELFLSASKLKTIASK